MSASEPAGGELMGRDPLTYADVGVSLDAADAAVAAIRPHVARTLRPEVTGAFGGFSGLFALPPARWRAPLLATSCDGVGTKLEIARQLGRYDTIGQDLVAMVVDDLVVCGAEPLVFNDYIAVGVLDVAAVEQVVAGIADGCVAAGCALVGGETAEHPAVMAPGQVDVAGFGVGVVERDAVLGPERVVPGDDLVAMASTGLHSNGYSLARRVVEGLDFADDHDLVVETLGDALLRPSRIYVRDCLALIEAIEVHALCHVTGGGVPGNLPRVLPDGLGAVVDAGTFTTPAIMELIAARGPVEPDEMWRTFNMGAGMIAVVPDGVAAAGLLRDRDVDAWVCGAVTDHPGVELAGR
ncbi:MAG TPA: phosphoribosylformylglycinamidine cyclo-ligase [Euzebyales bacterium]|nr:phosphoribosylformylglycinamidine cyclo-ligase [Euzebyales bacterium]